jgi:oligoribonuclease
VTHAKSKDNLVWIDLEMTGLDPEKEGIIEMATIVTDKNLNILAEGPNLVIKQPARLLARMDDWNQKQHGKSGLLEKVKKSKVTVRAAEKKTLRFIRKYCVAKKTALAGNSVYHDRRFIIRYMQELDKFLHYRLIDVSTLKDLVRRWYPKNKSAPKKRETHRALDDIRESIEELRYYRKTYFKEP